MINNNLRRGTSEPVVPTQKKAETEVKKLEQQVALLDIKEVGTAPTQAKSPFQLPKPSSTAGLRANSASVLGPATSNPAEDFHAMAAAHQSPSTPAKVGHAQDLLSIASHSQGLKTVFLAYTHQGEPAFLLGAHNRSETRHPETSITTQHAVLAATLTGQLTIKGKTDPAFKAIAKGAIQGMMRKPGAPFRSIGNSTQVQLGGTRLIKEGHENFTLTPSAGYGFADVPQKVIEQTAHYYANLFSLAGQKNAAIKAGHDDLKPLVEQVQKLLSESTL